MNATQLFWLAVNAGALGGFMLGYGFCSEVIFQQRESIAWVYWPGGMLVMVAVLSGLFSWGLKVSGSG